MLLLLPPPPLNAKDLVPLSIIFQKITHVDPVLLRAEQRRQVLGHGGRGREREAVDAAIQVLPFSFFDFERKIFVKRIPTSFFFFLRLSRSSQAHFSLFLSSFFFFFFLRFLSRRKAHSPSTHHGGRAPLRQVAEAPRARGRVQGPWRE